MKLEKQINLCLYGVELYDVRQAKPRTPINDSVVIDGGRISALHRLGQSVQGYITGLYEAQGYAVGNIRKLRDFTANVDLAELWHEQATKALLHDPTLDDLQIPTLSDECK